MTVQLGFYVDTSICIGCKTCQVACKDKNNLEVGRTWRRVLEVSGGQWEIQSGWMVPRQVLAWYISLACNHCQAPACVQACPTHATTKCQEDGLVLIDPQRCVGCRYCEWACPYGVPQFDAARGVMTKCNFCVDLLAQGQNPVCVDACPMRALEFGNLDELRTRHGNLQTSGPLPAPDLTHPALVIGPHPVIQI